MKDLSWITFCRKNGLGLVGLSFSSPKGHRQERGYYYPERGSGDLLCEGIRQIYGELPSFYLFGFSGGAHFVHRLSIFRPKLVKGFVAYSAAWWAEIPKGMIPVPGLILCGENDPRLEASRAFWLSGVLEKQPWIWRSYSQSGHEIYPQALRLSRCFFEDLINKISDQSWIGDTQTYEIFLKKSLQADKIPLEALVQLTSKTVAEEWKKD